MSDKDIETSLKVIVALTIIISLGSFIYFEVISKPKQPDTVLLRKDKAIVSCEVHGHEHCGLYLKCGDGSIVRCATNVEVTK